jgi:Flp pilus assembly protein TadG
MRIIMKSQRKDLVREEEGATAIIVVASLLLIFGMIAFSVDIGNGWQTRRSLTRATDAAALAAAGTYAEDGNGCAVAQDFLTANEPGSSLDDCTLGPAGSPGTGYVTVDGSSEVQFIFASILGLNNSTVVSSSTTAQFYPPGGVLGLRPIGICLDHPAVTSWLAAGSPEDETVRRITYGKDSNADCGKADGNWGLLTFSGAQSNTVFKQTVENGHDEEISVNDPVDGFTGSFNNSITDELNTLLDQTFSFPIFSECDPCTGANTEYTIVGFMSATLIDFKVTGNQADRYLDVIFRRLTLSGSCCGDPSTTAARSIRMCAVDPTFPISDCQL